MLQLRSQAVRQTPRARRIVSRVSPPRYARWYSRPPALQDDNNPPRSNATQLTNPPTSVTIPSPDGQTTHAIKRSFPKGKPEKLLASLVTLLSPSNNNNKTWTLSATGDAIHLTLTLHTRSQTDMLTQKIAEKSHTLSHHAHTSCQQDQHSGRWVYAVTCTTHNPHGLSLKDARLAEAVNQVVEAINAATPGAVGVGVDVGSLGAVLVRRNEEAAERARADPRSVCAVGA